MLYRELIQPLLFLLPAETAHRLVIGLMRFMSRVPLGVRVLGLFFGKPDPSLRVQAFGRELSSPLGLAAGLDKDAEAFQAFFALGFGFVEVGTLTAQPQPGNPLPRLFRLPADRALVNRMGFNNRGAADAAQRLTASRPESTLLGVNIGKSKAAAPEQAIEDYVASARVLAQHADYMVVNVSSPNTPGLRDLQAVDALRPLLVSVRAALDAVSPERRVPLLCKIAPDLADADVDAVADLALELGLDGIVAVNTTVKREGLRSAGPEVERCGQGGLSGAPLAARALEVLRRLRGRLGDRLTLVSVGGVQRADDVWDRLRAGATLVQIYTALVYDGPGLPRRIERELARKLRAAGLRNLSELRENSAP
ncbi:MAG: quinone-dependent dihydroorotate dehydrogenase [Polyangiales bacterium]